MTFSRSFLKARDVTSTAPSTSSNAATKVSIDDVLKGSVRSTAAAISCSFSWAVLRATSGSKPPKSCLALSLSTRRGCNALVSRRLQSVLQLDARTPWNFFPRLGASSSSSTRTAAAGRQARTGSRLEREASRCRLAGLRMKDSMNRPQSQSQVSTGSTSRKRLTASSGDTIRSRTRDDNAHGSVRSRSALHRSCHRATCAR